MAATTDSQHYYSTLLCRKAMGAVNPIDSGERWKKRSRSACVSKTNNVAEFIIPPEDDMTRKVITNLLQVRSLLKDELNFMHNQLHCLANDQPIKDFINGNCVPTNEFDSKNDIILAINEKLVSLKTENKELHQKLDKYEDRIRELEIHNENRERAGTENSALMVSVRSEEIDGLKTQVKSLEEQIEEKNKKLERMQKESFAKEELFIEIKKKYEDIARFFLEGLKEEQTKYKGLREKFNLYADKYEEARRKFHGLCIVFQQVKQITGCGDVATGLEKELQLLGSEQQRNGELGKLVEKLKEACIRIINLEEKLSEKERELKETNTKLQVFELGAPAELLRRSNKTNDFNRESLKFPTNPSDIASLEEELTKSKKELDAVKSELIKIENLADHKNKTIEELKKFLNLRQNQYTALKKKLKETVIDNLKLIQAKNSNESVSENKKAEEEPVNKLPNEKDELASKKSNAEHYEKIIAEKDKLIENLKEKLHLTENGTNNEMKKKYEEAVRQIECFTSTFDKIRNKFQDKNTNENSCMNADGILDMIDKHNEELEKLKDCIYNEGQQYETILKEVQRKQTNILTKISELAQELDENHKELCKVKSERDKLDKQVGQLEEYSCGVMKKNDLFKKEIADLKDQLNEKKLENSRTYKSYEDVKQDVVKLCLRYNQVVEAYNKVYFKYMETFRTLKRQQQEEESDDVGLINMECLQNHLNVILQKSHDDSQKFICSTCKKRGSFITLSDCYEALDKSEKDNDHKDTYEEGNYEDASVEERPHKGDSETNSEDGSYQESLSKDGSECEGEFDEEEDNDYEEACREEIDHEAACKEESDDECTCIKSNDSSTSHEEEEENCDCC